MKALIVIVGMFAGSALGWWLGVSVSSDMLFCFAVSSVMSLVGVYLAWKLTRRLDEV